MNISDIIASQGSTARGKRLGWDVEPGDDVDLAWKDTYDEDIEVPHEVTGELTAHDFDPATLSGGSVFIGNLPVDPATVELMPEHDGG